MSVADDIGTLNDAALLLGEAAATTEEGSQELDSAGAIILAALEKVRLVRQDIQSPTLTSYEVKLQDALQSLREAQNACVRTILSLNNGKDLGQTYIGRLHL